jgi:hypothetical protein
LRLSDLNNCPPARILEVGLIRQFSNFEEAFESAQGCWLGRWQGSQQPDVGVGSGGVDQWLFWDTNPFFQDGFS